ncbi:bola-like protein [Nadsonia fulvescens var. elongata DSM 6958]|uniref:Bola-like protein n=1 Tax=Nadsonia fulvescens var. elongata DSM 6958 TaxID=857566 RepID=A0A1E3PGI1_9ASCO|nr:bola-like protein [Nadsonia fulvescens var. elongata DSM 6958]
MSLNVPRLLLKPLRTQLFCSELRVVTSHTPLRKFPSLVTQYSTKPEPPTELDQYETKIFKKLADAFEPALLDVRDVSGGCGSMFAINISSSKFKGVPMVKQHRLVNELLAEEIKTWHGLQLRTKSA